VNIYSFIFTVLQVLNTTLAAKQTDLDNNKQLQKQMQQTIDGLTVTVQANNQTIQELLERQKQCQATVDGKRNTEGANNKTIQVLREKLDQLCQYLIEAAKSGDVNTTKTLAHSTNDICTADDDYRNKVSRMEDKRCVRYRHEIQVSQCCLFGLQYTIIMYITIQWSFYCIVCVLSPRYSYT
jgi:chromosome segregation ATPase